MSSASAPISSKQFNGRVIGCRNVRLNTFSPRIWTQRVFVERGVSEEHLVVFTDRASWYTVLGGDSLLNVANFTHLHLLCSPQVTTLSLSETDVRPGVCMGHRGMGALNTQTHLHQKESKERESLENWIYWPAALRIRLYTHYSWKEHTW